MDDVVDTLRVNMEVRSQFSLSNTTRRVPFAYLAYLALVQFCKVVFLSLYSATLGHAKSPPSVLFRYVTPVFRSNDRANVFPANIESFTKLVLADIPLSIKTANVLDLIGAQLRHSLTFSACPAFRMRERSVSNSRGGIKSTLCLAVLRVFFVGSGAQMQRVTAWRMIAIMQDGFYGPRPIKNKVGDAMRLYRATANFVLTVASGKLRSLPRPAFRWLASFNFIPKVNDGLRGQAGWNRIGFSHNLSLLNQRVKLWLGSRDAQSSFGPSFILSRYSLGV